MTHQVMKYRLTAEGTIPDFLYLGQDGVGGVFGVADSSTPWPRDLVQIGITNPNATGDFEAIATQADLQAYLSEVGANWTQLDKTNPNSMEATIPFDPVASAQWVWDRKVALGKTYE